MINIKNSSDRKKVRAVLVLIQYRDTDVKIKCEAKPNQIGKGEIACSFVNVRKADYHYRYGGNKQNQLENRKGVKPKSEKEDRPKKIKHKLDIIDRQCVLGISAADRHYKV